MKKSELRKMIREEIENLSEDKNMGTDWTETEMKVIAAAISMFGSGGHPWPDKGSLEHFKRNYVSDCLNKALKKGSLTQKGKSLVKSILDKI